MILIKSPTLVTEESKIADFLQKSVGQWRSERRYYTLPSVETQEVISELVIEWLEAGCSELLKLAELHQLSASEPLVCGLIVSWDGKNVGTGHQASQGSSMFGLRGNILYRDRGFAIATPVCGNLRLLNADTLCLKTEYNGSVFEEETKYIGQQYRSRQTISSRLGEEIMVGQYLEKRIN